MRAKEFSQLLKSVQQAGKIRRGRMKPGRTVTFRPAGVRAIRTGLKKVNTKHSR